MSLVDGGGLLISETRSSDSGAYRCAAQNMAGVRQTDVATLKVVTPPRVVRAPQDREAVRGATAEFQCQVINSGKLL